RGRHTRLSRVWSADVCSADLVVEASGVAGDQTLTIGAPTFTATAVDGVTTSTAYTLALVGGTATGLETTVGNHAITLHVDSETRLEERRVGRECSERNKTDSS